MVDTYITVHKDRQDAELWAAQLPHLGQHLIEIKGPLEGVKLDNHMQCPPVNISHINSSGCWLVLAGR